MKIVGENAEAYDLGGKMRGRWGNKVVGTAVALGLVLLSQTAFKMGVVGAAGETLSNPRIEKDERMEAKQKVTYDCVWFGSYPQAEVIPSKSYTALDSCLRQKGDVIVSNSVYFALKKASNWDINNEIVLNGEKYRRIRSQDATYWNRGENVAAKYYRERYYHWENSTTYHYFKFEPIKWRILHINEKNQALVLSDIVLDGQKYHAEKENVTWEKSTLRSWLNGYGGGSNQKSVDYKQKNFFYSAFNSTEQMAILNTELENVDNYINGSSIDGGNNTVDKIFLLSEADIYEMEESESYGFAKDLRSGTSKTDEALLCKSSTYAKAMGICNTNPHFDDFTGTCSWWLRSQGQHKDYAAESECGWVDDIGIDVDYDENGIRPVLNLDLSHFQCYSYAGKVCTNESVENGNLPISESKKGISKLKVIAKRGKKKIVITTIKGAKIKLALSERCIKKGKKLVKSTTVSAKKNKKGKVTIVLRKALKKRAKITVTVSKTGYKTKKKTIRVS